MDLEHGCLFRIVAFLITLEVDSLWTLEIKSKADSSPFQPDTLLHSFVNLKQGWFLFSSVISSGGLNSEHSLCKCFGNLKFGSSPFASSCFGKNAVVAWTVFTENPPCNCFGNLKQGMILSSPFAFSCFGKNCWSQALLQQHGAIAPF